MSGQDALATGSNSNTNTPEAARGEARSGDWCPGFASVAGFVNAATANGVDHRARIAGLDMMNPHGGETDLGIIRCKVKIDCAGSVVLVEDLAPSLPAVSGFEDAAFRIRSEGLAESGGK